jgi:hypothetical protein
MHFRYSVLVPRKAKKPLQKVIKSSQHAPPARDFVGALTAAYRRTGADHQGEEGVAEQRCDPGGLQSGEFQRVLHASTSGRSLFTKIHD